jgi:transposase
MKVRLRRGDRAILEARLRAATTEQRQLLRIRIVLEAADGHGTREIARELETTPTTVSLWRIRYAREGLDGLEDRLRPAPRRSTARQPTPQFARSSTSHRPRALRVGMDP